jgi:hypothetical protein
VFPIRKAANAAIQRTEHYRLAFSRTDLPEKQLCKVAPVVFTQPLEAEDEDEDE